MRLYLRARVFVVALAAVQCGDNSNVVGNLFPDGGPTGTGGTSLDTSVGPSTSSSTVATGSGGLAGSSATGAGGSSTGAGGGSTTSTGGGGGAGGSGGVTPFPCVAPMEITTPPSGYVRCSNGMVHRPEKRQCPESLPRPEIFTDAGSAPCRRDADCQAKPHGYCEYWSSLAGSGYACRYGCVNDNECAAGQICRCGNLTGSCVSTSGCTVDADCGGALMCVGYYETCEATRFACQSADDTCGGDLDCRSVNCTGSSCACSKNGTKASCAPRCVAAQ